ncbi:MAG: MFS transporter [Clostridiales bacterium]|nr:MFS transporter [Clostridiales bacterium]
MQKRTWTFNHTIKASYVAYIVQAIINNFVPLLLVTFQRDFGISLEKIALLVGFNFAVQLVVDLIGSLTIDRIGYRPAIVAAHVLTTLGMLLLGILPHVMDPFTGLMVAVVVYAMGGGILEVLVSPIVEACPTENKAGAMSLLHSFYCWGHMAVVLLSTAFFLAFGVSSWRYMAWLWALVPAVNIYVFLNVPINTLPKADVRPGNYRRLLGSPIFWLLFVLMVCAGASEQGMAQWASAFAELGLRVSKAVGDVLGPTFFALMMGIARALHAKYSERLKVQTAMVASASLCIVAYLVAAFSPNVFVALFAVGACGFSVGLFWPGTFSLAAVDLPTGGIAMYALLALAGDLGCSAGPSLVGLVSSRAGGNLSYGFLAAIIFPVALILFVWLLNRKKQREPGASLEAA